MLRENGKLKLYRAYYALRDSRADPSPFVAHYLGYSVVQNVFVHRFVVQQLASALFDQFQYVSGLIEEKRNAYDRCGRVYSLHDAQKTAVGHEQTGFGMI